MRKALVLATGAVLVLAGGGWLWTLRPVVIRPETPALMPREVPPEEPEVVLANLDQPFRCTIYYTPRESGFDRASGFDVTPETRPGLAGKTFPHDFLVAVQKEGYGRLAEPVDGRDYIRFCGGKWAFAHGPTDCHDQPLVAKRSSAIKAGHRLVRQESKFKLSGKSVPADFERLRWVVSDTGSGLEDGQLDLYWGEDDPLGPGARLSQPKSGPATIEHAKLIVLR